MPTTIWITETAEDRFWEAAPPVPPPPSFSCPYCEEQFASPTLLENHIHRSHLLDLPALLLRGGHIPAESVIRTAVRETDVRLLNCTQVQVRKDAAGPRSLTARQFRALIADETCAHWHVKLINSRDERGPQSEREYRLEFRIPARAELDEVDRFFIQYLAVDHPKHKDIQLFAAGCPPEPSAREYIGALTDYVLGVMIKEQEEELVAPLGFDEYKAKFLAARSVLREFRRPVAEAVTSCVDFNLNGFTAPEAPSRLYALAVAHGLFRALARAKQPARRPPDSAPRFLAPICPTDTVTDALLSASARYMRGARLGVDTAETLSRMERARSVSEYDKPKIDVLCALFYLDAGRAEAVKHLRHVQFDSLFGEWARRRLEEAP